MKSDNHNAKDLQNYMLSNSENEIKRISFREENQILRQIEEGDLDSILMIQQNISYDEAEAIMNSQMGNTAHKRSKHFEYMICTAIALFCRASIDGGVDAESAYALSDLFLHRLERCNTPLEMMKLSYEAQIEFATMVRDQKRHRSHSTYVEKAKSYIANHLNKPFTLTEIAEACNISKSYLTQQFSQEEGMGIMEYTLHKRMEAACNMLKYSEEEISTIAAYLCFSSQSHFGAVFKKTIGTTPRKYRAEHSITDVIKD